MLLVFIVLTTLVVGVGSVWIANLLILQFQRKIDGEEYYLQQGLLSLAAGALLATAFTHLLPEAFESHLDIHQLFFILLIGVLFFFLLNKAEIWHHAHEHHDHTQHHSHKSGLSLLFGDGIHCFGDGILIASIFAVNIQLGLIAAASVLVHEIPHHMGDLAVLQRDNKANTAMLKLTIAGAMTALGGIAGYLLLSKLQHLQPYFMVLASSSFIYVALSDLVPQLQQRGATKDVVTQIIWLCIGMLLVVSINLLMHGEH
ncbi:ZIP family metal transporter [Acinetobacter sp. TR3]|uniref:ZIP family metal transporter n=1 Tax=Acinetobacter sp. TR3 TaxID=3003392 RepID=UPI000E59B25B|nr:ZIP family metal transporter [Acinetobacter sp. TR3]MDO7410117.1 ZIP family metal transporter [Acinetobacter baumannii]WAU78197.1 ZIP family metal transporter [Acinetobacter sp. TR3]